MPPARAVVPPRSSVTASCLHAPPVRNPTGLPSAPAPTTNSQEARNEVMSLPSKPKSTASRRELPKQRHGANLQPSSCSTARHHLPPPLQLQPPLQSPLQPQPQPQPLHLALPMTPFSPPSPSASEQPDERKLLTWTTSCPTLGCCTLPISPACLPLLTRQRRQCYGSRLLRLHDRDVIRSSHPVGKHQKSVA